VVSVVFDWEVSVQDVRNGLKGRPSDGGLPDAPAASVRGCGGGCSSWRSEARLDLSKKLLGGRRSGTG